METKTVTIGKKRVGSALDIKRWGISIMVFALAAAFSVPTMGANLVIFSDNFDSADTSGGAVPLLGRVSDTGQVWTNLGLFAAGGGLIIDPSISASGANDAAGGLVGNTGNTILMASTLSSYGSMIFDLDFESPGAANTPQFWLSNPAGTVNASLQWRADTGFLGWEGLGVTPFSVDTDTAAGGGTSLVRSLHVTLHIEFGAQTVDFSWFDNADPGDLTTRGSSGPFSYVPTYEPDRLHLYRNAGNGSSRSGYDNLVLAVPEPSSAALLGLGGLILLRRRRN